MASLRSSNAGARSRCSSRVAHTTAQWQIRQAVRSSYRSGANTVREREDANNRIASGLSEYGDDE